MRLFLAIFPPKDYLDYFRDTLRHLNKEKRNINPMPIDQIHVTVKYFGSMVSENTKDTIIDEFRLHEGNFGKALIDIKKIQLGFPRQSDPRILLADLRNTESLNKITDFSLGILKRLKFRDTINWKMKHTNDYHFTVAKIKPSVSKGAGKEIKHALEKLSEPKLEPITISEMYFMESIIQRDGKPVYRKLDKIRL